LLDQENDVAKFPWVEIPPAFIEPGLAGPVQAQAMHLPLSDCSNSGGQAPDTLAVDSGRLLDRKGYPNK
jgi:hypothetical protein